MIGSIVRQQIARTNRNLLVSNAVLLALILTYAFVTSLVTGQNQFFITRPAPLAAQNAEAVAPVDASHPTEITASDLDSEARLKQMQGHAVRLTDRQSVDLDFPVWNASQRSANASPTLQPKYRLSKRGSGCFSFCRRIRQRLGRSSQECCARWTRRTPMSLRRC